MPVGKALDPLVGDSPVLKYDPLVADSYGGKAQASGDVGVGPRRDTAYEGASRFSNELGLWSSPILSADQEIIPEKGQVDVRVRDLMRNDAFVRNGVTIKQDSIVGERFLLNSKPNYKILGLDEVWAEEFQEEVEAKFTLWAESPSNHPDASRMNTLTGLIRMIVGINAMAGESLTSVEWLRDVGRPFNTCFQLIDLDRLSNPNLEADTRTLRGGVKRNDFGAPVGYYIRNGHPSDMMDPGSYTWKYVPIAKPWGRIQMIHMVDQWRPDQSRGISMLVSAIKETKMGKQFRDIVLQNAVLNATYAASIESDLPSDVAMAQAGGGDKHALNNFAADYLASINEYVGGTRNLQIDGVKIPVFFPGTKMKLQPAGTPGGLGTNFEQSLHRYTAAALGIGYSEFSKDFSDANYSNLKAELAGTERHMRVQKRQNADRAANHFFALWLEEALNKGEITAMPRNAPSFYEGLNKEAYCEASWIGASMGQIDELKETQAAVLRLNNGLSTREDELAKLGKDWRPVLAQLSREKKAAEALGLEFGADKSSTNMMNAAGGTPSEEGAKPRSETKEDKTDE